MKTLGIIGGTGPESTIEYYRLTIAKYRQKRTDGSYPAIIINSIELKKMLDLIAAQQLENVTAYLAAEVEKLSSAGADFGLLLPIRRTSFLTKFSAIQLFLLSALWKQLAARPKRRVLSGWACSERVSPCKPASTPTSSRRQVLCSSYLQRTSKPTYMRNT
jgi:hypothetical protein